MSKEFKKLFSTVIITAMIFFSLGILTVKVADNNQIVTENTTIQNKQRQLSEPIWFELNNTEDLKDIVTKVEKFDGNLNGFETNFQSKIYEIHVRDNHGNTKNYLFVE
ncbi:hypothetical protein K5E_11290 [Enterococcus thailandicus]|nr:hypothetical protein K4E_00830 [Enterococcus thailandicus]GMC08990.1 hypothetical protein K5E_11290 [Enterococcus thailandicus]